MLIINEIRRRASARAARFRHSHRSHRGASFTLAVIALFALSASSDAALKVYHLRHAEGGHNALRPRSPFQLSGRRHKSRHMHTFNPEAPGGSSLYLLNNSTNPARARR